MKELEPRRVYAGGREETVPWNDCTVDPGIDLANPFVFLILVVPAVVLEPEVVNDPLSLENIPLDLPDR